MGRRSIGEIIYDEIDELLVYISLSKPVGVVKRARISLNHFDKAEILNSEVAPRVLKEVEKITPGYFYDAQPGDVGGKWDVSMLSLGNKYEDFTFALQRFRNVAPKTIRGIGNYRGSFIGEISAVFFDVDKEQYTPGCIDYVQVVAKQTDGNLMWDYVGKAHCYDGFRRRELITRDDSAFDLSQRCNTIIGIQFNRNYQWMVCLGYEGYPSLSFATDPSGVRALFRMRDVPEGKQRRTALRHWVSEHWRKQRSNDNDLSWIRAHLRGAMKFDWFGLQCTVIPSADDIRKNKLLTGDRNGQTFVGIGSMDVETP